MIGFCFLRETLWELEYSMYFAMGLVTLISWNEC